MMITKKLKISIPLLLMIILSGCASKAISLQAPPLEVPKKSIPDNSFAHLVSCRKEVTLICKPLMLTEIRLLPGESIISLNSGDTARWLFQIIVSDTENYPAVHILVKPKDNNIKTNLIVVTNQRVYRINLVSNTDANLKGPYAYTDPMVHLGNDNSHIKIDSNYVVKVPFFQKIPKWVPRSIYNDGKSVFICMPNLNRYQAPSFYELNEHNQLTVINYPVYSNYYRIDQLFSKGILISGVGRSQQKVIINYLGDK